MNLNLRNMGLVCSVIDIDYELGLVRQSAS